MKLSRYGQRLALVVAVLAVVAGCGSASRRALDHPPSLVALGPHLTETLFALGAGGRLVGVDDASRLPEEAGAVPRVGPAASPDIEAIAALGPDLVLLDRGHAETERALMDHGLALLALDFGHFEAIGESVVRIGEAVGRYEEAEALVERAKEDTQTIRDQVMGHRRPRALIVVERAPGPIERVTTVGGMSFLSELADVAGGENIFGASVEAQFEATRDQIVAKAPEVIVEFRPGAAAPDEERAACLADWAALPDLPAVAQGRIHVITEPHALEPGPRLLDVARMLAGLFHPQDS